LVFFSAPPKGHDQDILVYGRCTRPEIEQLFALVLVLDWSVSSRIWCCCRSYLPFEKRIRLTVFRLMLIYVRRLHCSVNYAIVRARAS